VEQYNEGHPSLSGYFLAVGRCCLYL